MKKFLRKNINYYTILLSLLIGYPLFEFLGLWDGLMAPPSYVRSILLDLVLLTIVILIVYPFFLFRKERLNNGRPF